MRLISTCFFAVGFATQAGAVIIGSATASYTQGANTLTDSDATLPAAAEQSTGGQAGTNDGGDPVGDGVARARQNALGFSSVRVDANFFSGGLGPGTQERLTATTVFDETVTNTTGGTVAYEFDLFLKNMFVDIYDFAGAALSPNPFDDPTSGAIGGRLLYDVAVNGSTVFAFSAEVFGSGSSVTVDQSDGVDGTAPDGTTVASSLAFTTTPNTGGPIVAFDDLFATISAGSFGAGQTVNLVATMTAEIVAFPFELGAIANIADPNALSGTADESGVSLLRVSGAPQVVPLPAAGWLLLSGLGALAALRRRAA